MHLTMGDNWDLTKEYYEEKLANEKMFELGV